MSALYLIRHGPTHQKVMTGHRDVDVDLSDTATLSRLSNVLPSDGVVISSDLRRAKLTADKVAADRRRLPNDPMLREINFGQWDGLHHTEISTRWPELSRQYWENPGEIAPPDGESWNAVCRRVDKSIKGLRLSHPATSLIIVAHFGVILTQVQKALGITAYQAFSHRIDPLSLTTINSDGTLPLEQINQYL